MSDNLTHFCWDSCVFIRYLIGDPLTHLTHIEQHIQDARDGKTMIHYSTIALAEIRPSHLKKKGYGDMQSFLDDFEGAFVPCAPTPDILTAAAVLRDRIYPNPNGGDDRCLGTADAIHMLTALHLRQTGLPDLVFHTLDAGKGSTWEGKCVPLLGYEEWAKKFQNIPVVFDICDMPRRLPLHPEPSIFAAAAQ